MSRHITIFTLFLRRYVIALTCILALLFTACVDHADYYKNFLAVATQAPSQGYTMYWLGRSFTAGGLTFKGPAVPDFGAGQEGGVEFSYNAPGGAGLDIAVLSDAAFAHPAPTPARATTKTVTILGRPAELQSAAAGTRPVNVLILPFSLGNTHVVASVHSGGAVTPSGPDVNLHVWSATEQRFVTATAIPRGPDVNPLVNDEQMFLSVMQQLRPYPQ